MSGAGLNEQFKKYKNKGLSGLTNQGNTCYLNSCMQVLSHTYELNLFLEDEGYKKKLNQIPDSVITLEWDKLRELLWKTNCVIAPYGFIKSVKKIASLKNRDIFTGYLQNDLQEFLLFIIDCFHMSLARKVNMQIVGTSQNSTDELAVTCYDMMRQMYNKEYSEILDLFFGIHVSEISDISTGASLSLRPEPFSVLSLSIPSESTINNSDNSNNNSKLSIFDCFDLYCKKELLSGEEAWFNEKTNKKESVNRGILFWSLPKILIIDIKRWKGYTSITKNSVYIDTPLTNVDFSNYVKGYNRNSYIYELYGVCNHLGGVNGGHYTAYIKNANGKWYEMNDMDVKEIPESNVVSCYSYCFFYRKI